MVEWWAWVFIVIGILFFVIGGFSASRKFKRGEYGWYRRSYNSAPAVGAERDVEKVICTGTMSRGD